MTSFLSWFRARFPGLWPHVEQGFKFAVSGGIGAVVDLGTLTMLVQYGHVRPEVGTIFSTFLALVCVYLLNKFFTFSHRRGKTHVQLLKFGVVYATAILLNYVIFLFFLSFGVHYFLSKCLAIGIVMFWNYFMLHSFVFAGHRE